MISCLHVNHLNALVEDRDESLAHFSDLYGAQFLLDKPESEYILIAIGTVIFELFAPQNFLLHARLGPHYNGIEYQVPDVGEVRQELGRRGIRIVGDIDVAFYTHPADTFGVGIEFYHRNFHTDGIPNGYLEPIKPIEYWRDEHPLGCTGLKRYSLVVGDVGAATKFFQDLMGATVVYEEPRPAIGALAVGLHLGGTVAELLTPTEDGDDPARARPVRRRHPFHRLRGPGPGPGAVLLRTSGASPCIRGDAPDTLAISPEDNRGLLFEFAE